MDPCRDAQMDTCKVAQISGWQSVRGSQEVGAGQGYATEHGGKRAQPKIRRLENGVDKESRVCKTERPRELGHEERKRLRC
eukprot:5898941-Pleurochrysis_carterae.AAC.1